MVAAEPHCPHSATTHVYPTVTETPRVELADDSESLHSVSESLSTSQSRGSSPDFTIGTINNLCKKVLEEGELHKEKYDAYLHTIRRRLLWEVDMNNIDISR